MNPRFPIYTVFLTCLLLLPQQLPAEDIAPERPAMSMYSSTPPVLSSGEKPSVMIMLDNSWGMYRLAYQPQTRDDSIVWKPKYQGKAFDHTKKYYGLFTSGHYYKYNKQGDYNM